MGVALGYAVLAYQLAGTWDWPSWSSTRRRWPPTSTRLLGSAGRADPDRHAALRRAGRLRKAQGSHARQDRDGRRTLHALIRSLDIPQAEKDRLLAMTPGSYVGKAAELARRA